MLKILLVALALQSSLETPAVRREAELCLQRGNEAFRDNRIADAIKEYDAAYKLVPSAKLLYNLGRAYEAAGRKREALDAFAGFIAATSTAAAPAPGPGVNIGPGVSSGPGVNGGKDLTDRIESARSRVSALEAELDLGAHEAPVPDGVPLQQERVSRAAPVRPGAEPVGVAVGVTADAHHRVGVNQNPLIPTPPGVEARPAAPPAGRLKWWLIGAGAVAAAAAATVLLSTRGGGQGGCGERHDLGCL